MFPNPAPIMRIRAGLAAADAAVAGVVGELISGREQVVAESGLSLAVWLSAVSRLPKTERTQLLVASDVLPSLPLVRDRFNDGIVSWPVVSRICGRASGLSTSERATVDERMSDAIDHLAGDCTADAILDVLWELLAQMKYSRERDRERRLERGEFLAISPFLDGTGGSFYAEYGAVNFAAVTDAIIDAAPTPELQRNVQQDPRVTAENRRSISQARAEGLVELCSRNGDGSKKTSKVLATVSMETLLGMSRATGDLLTQLVGGRMHLTAHAARRLADGGCTFRMIVHDESGATVGVGTQTSVQPEWLRDATIAFNAVCTCPGCSIPGRLCDIDHAQEFRDGGPTDAGNLHPAHRGRHTQKTGREWTVTRAADQSTTWTDNVTGLSVTQPSLWAIKNLASGTHPANRTTVHERQPS